VKVGDEARMGAEVFFSRDARGVDVRAVARDGAKKALAKLGVKPPKTGRYPIVLESQVAAEIIGLVASGFSAKEVFERNSLFAGKLGQKVAGTELTLLDDPHLEGGLGSRAFDGEGAWTMRTRLIEAGILKSFVTDSVHAKRMGLPHTANAARGARSELGIGFSNLVVQSGTEPLESLLASYPSVILITEFKGYHAGYQGRSGDFSFESEGELWENGNRVGPLCNFVTSGNVKELLMSIQTVGSRYAPRVSSIVCPDILIRDLAIAGVD
jgi:PmbA protein